jgi:hypothetical protein
MPKSETFARRPGVTNTLEGLRSRWTTPRPPGPSEEIVEGLRRQERPPRHEQLGEGLALDELEHQEGPRVDLHRPLRLHEVGVLAERDPGAHLLDEPPHHPRLPGEIVPHRLGGHEGAVVPLEDVHHPHPARVDGKDLPSVEEPVAGADLDHGDARFSRTRVRMR